MISHKTIKEVKDPWNNYNELIELNLSYDPVGFRILFLVLTPIN